MEFKLDQGAMEALVHKAIFDSMTPEKRDQLLQEAIRKLTEIPNGYSRTSALTEAYQNGARRVAEDVVKQDLESNEKYKEMIRKLFLDVVERLFASDFREKLIDKICENVVSGLNRY